MYGLRDEYRADVPGVINICRREGGRQGRSRRRKEVGRKRKESKSFLLFQAMLNLIATSEF